MQYYAQKFIAVNIHDEGTAKATACVDCAKIPHSCPILSPLRLLCCLDKHISAFIVLLWGCSGSTRARTNKMHLHLLMRLILLADTQPMLSYCTSDSHLTYKLIWLQLFTPHENRNLKMLYTHNYDHNNSKQFMSMVW